MTIENPIYLSRLTLNPKNKEVQGDLADCQKMHCRVMKSFPDNLTAEEKAGLRALYRIDFNRHEKKMKLLVQSRIAPDWSRLPKDYLLDDFAEPDNPAIERVDDTYGKLREGMRLRFRLRTNPTRKIDTRSTPDGKRRNGKRVELTKEEDQIAWLERKAESVGFQLLSVQINPDVLNLRVDPETKSVGWRKDGSDQARKRRLTFGSALFEGELLITDADRFRQALAQGIGSGKAYGFGLLSIARASN